MGRENNIIIVAGATGQLGSRIVDHLLDKNSQAKALIRPGSDEQKVKALISKGVDVVEVDYKDPASLAKACRNATCIVSALSGLREVIIDAQSRLLTAALEAGVPRFIPSDFCIDYRNLPAGQNRNLDLRREFSTILALAPIKSTSILNGMFTDLLMGDAPLILFNQKRIFFWGDADQKMDFTTIDDTAKFTANVALDNDAPRWLTIAGEVASMRDLQHIASEVSGEEFRMLRPGGLGFFKLVIRLTKTMAPGNDETFPAWQGMQYLYDMLSGAVKFPQLDNKRYNGIRWQSIGEVLKLRYAGSAERELAKSPRESNGYVGRRSNVRS
jgi:uncharacterized protein YbjT (DUF2867 family)